MGVRVGGQVQLVKYSNTSSTRNQVPGNAVLSNDNPCPIPPKWEIPGNTKRHVHM